MFNHTPMIIYGLTTFMLLTYVKADIIINTPGHFSWSICHNIPYIGGSCSGSSFSQPTCTLDQCADQALNEEMKEKYNEFVSQQQQRPDKEYSYLPFKDTLLLVNGLFVTIPKAVFTMTKLTDITITQSKLRKINLNEFLTLSNLTNINLDNNTIIALETNEDSSGNSTVQRIDMSFNFIEAVPNKFVKRFTELKHLNMSHNMISNIAEYAFEGAMQLEILDLSYNRLQQVTTIFSQLPKLIDPSEVKFNTLQNLVKLFLDDNLIVNINFSQFFETGVSELSIGGNPIPCKELALIKYYSNMAHKFNRIVTAKNLGFKGDGSSVNGISCEKTKEGGIAVVSDYPSSDTIILITGLKNELKSAKEQFDFFAEGTGVFISHINRELREIKKQIAGLKKE